MASLQDQATYYGGTEANPADRPYLSRISDAADELELTAGFIQSFLDRCRGTGENGAKLGPTPVPSGHFGQLDRLQDNIRRVDCLARELNTVG